MTRRYEAIAPHRATSRGGWARLGAAAMTLFLGMTDAGAIPAARHYLHDAQGTPIAITTQEGALAQRSAFDPWGNPTQQDVIDTSLNANPNRIGFTGYALDVEGSRATNGGSATANSPIANARYYAKARYYGGGRGGFISVDPWSGDETNPLSYNKYLYGYANPGMYIDPDGRAGFLTDLRDRFDRTDAILREQAVNSTGTAGLLGYSLARGLAAAGSAIPRALNLASDGIAQALPGEAFIGVRADGAAEFGSAVDAGVYVASNPGQVVRDIHGNAVQATVALAEGDRGAASDAISFFGQLGSGAAVGRKFVAATAAAEGRLPATSREGADGQAAAQFHDEAMFDELERGFSADRSFVESQRKIVERQAAAAQNPTEAASIRSAQAEMRKRGYQIEDIDLRYRGQQGVDQVYSRIGSDTDFAIVENKSGRGVNSLRTDSRGMRQGSRGYNADRIRNYLSYGDGAHDVDATALLEMLYSGDIENMATFARSGRTLELPPTWPISGSPKPR